MKLVHAVKVTKLLIKHIALLLLYYIHSDCCCILEKRLHTQV